MTFCAFFVQSSEIFISSGVDSMSQTERKHNDEQDIAPLHASRINKDIVQFFTSPVPDIMLCPDANNILVSHAIIIGPDKTPYEGGFFYFYIKLPHDYPFSPPTVKLMTTDQNRVRFNPNLYACGRVCLSILNTWSGPQWSPGNTLMGVLLSIQSVLNEEPYKNEPGASSLPHRCTDPVAQYNKIILHETIRVAISYYEQVITSNLCRDGHQMKDPFNQPRGKFQYKQLLVEFNKLKGKYS
ncbi:Ubiquitin-conjugating enzyme E2 Z [Pseudolycoriella hygida]|uniref:Ubiquitin-conjugating enzyme E2 Z n=1 Tax=Pseudolycoriella hygida TaxID=35572 RepID=A0A9Q0S515_9DIPT|nr:Ubiquitin-conjugating enzyme E2 Z [Pseudolycoriella hygida]